ncbi:MAG TPA: hypothetical protein VG276_00070 [Actinomycetes bacterium]|nr:hypothetical protein [Actinomycetes bacterium]
MKTRVELYRAPSGHVAKVVAVAGGVVRLDGSVERRSDLMQAVGLVRAVGAPAHEVTDEHEARVHPAAVTP